MTKAVSIVSIVVVLLSLSVSAQQSDVESLKIVHGSLTDLVASGDSALLESLVHPEAMGFFRDSQLPVSLSSRLTITDIAPALLNELSKFNRSTYDTMYRVIGDTGIVCARGAMVPVKLSGRKANTVYDRVTYIYSRINGNWRLVSWHSSDMPVKAN